MVGATAAMVAVTVGADLRRRRRCTASPTGPREDLLERTPYIEAVFDDPVPAEEGE